MSYVGGTDIAALIECSRYVRLHGGRKSRVSVVLSIIIALINDN